MNTEMHLNYNLKILLGMAFNECSGLWFLVHWYNPNVKCTNNTSLVYSGVVGSQFAVAQAFQAVFSQCAVLFMEHGESLQKDTETVK